jgi:hypothetical protein
VWHEVVYDDGMKKIQLKENTESHGVRLPVSYWIKLRSLMTHHGGRHWLEKAIDREARKVGIGGAEK